MLFIIHQNKYSSFLTLGAVKLFVEGGTHPWFLGSVFNYV